MGFWGFGVLDENTKGGGQFREVTLNPLVIVAEESMINQAIELHHKAHSIC